MTDKKKETPEQDVDATKTGKKRSAKSKVAAAEKKEETAASEQDTPSTEQEEEETTAPEATAAPVNDDVEEPEQPATSRPPAKPLALKMARVMAEVRHVPKNGRNDFHKYDYIMESDLVDRLRGRLAEQGVAIFPSIREHVVTPTKDHRGKVQYLATVTLEVTFIDSESGDQMTTTWVGQGMDAGDKSYYKAYTGAFKYALLKTFMVTGEDDSPPQKVRAPRSSRGQSGGRRRAAR